MRSVGGTPAHPSISVVVSTYEWPEALDLMLHALSESTDPDFDVLVADDGSGDTTAGVVDRWQGRFGSRLRHVWQSDEGWRKSRVLNLASLEARGDYLVFLDGDVIPRRSFVGAVRSAALPGWFLATKRVYLSESFSRRVLEGRLPVWRWSAARWLLRERGEVRRAGYLIPLRDRRRPWRREQPDFFPPDNAYGFFVGVSRADFWRVNGHDMRFVGRDSEDHDLALRFERIGLRCGWPGPGATLFHLWHSRVSERRNEPLFFETRASERFEALEGLRELAEELGPRARAHRVGASRLLEETTDAR